MTGATRIVTMIRRTVQRRIARAATAGRRETPGALGAAVQVSLIWMHGTKPRQPRRPDTCIDTNLDTGPHTACAAVLSHIDGLLH